MFPNSESESQSCICPVLKMTPLSIPPVASLSEEYIHDGTDVSYADYSLSHLMDVCVNFELAQLSCIVENHLFTSLDAKPWTGPSQQPGQLSQGTSLPDILAVFDLFLSPRLPTYPSDHVIPPLYGTGCRSGAVRSSLLFLGRISHSDIPL